MQGFDVILTIMRPLEDTIAQYIGTKIWIQRISNGQVTEKLLGELDTEYGVYRPLSQPLKDTYIIVACGEYEGQVNLITADGDFITLPGYHYGLGKPGFIYTRQSNQNQDGLTCMFNLKSKKGVDLRSRNVSAENLSFEEVQEAYWVK